MFKVKKINNKDVYYSDILNIEHFFTSRDYELKNNPKNLEILAKYLNISIKNIIKPAQTHSDNVEILKPEKIDYPDCDALILDDSQYAIYLNFADCVPVILYDPIHNIGAISHAGWRGTASQIVPKTVQKMQKFYNTKPNDLIAVIGPAISFKYFETYPEALKQLKTSVKNQNGLFKDNYADLKGINKMQLNEAGVEKVDVCPYCTVDDNDKFFSYRKENKTLHRHSAVLKIPAPTYHGN